MKKRLALVVLLGISVFGYGMAEAGPGRHGRMGAPGSGGCCQFCGGPGSGAELDEESLAARDKFFNETVNLRRQVVVKSAEIDALMSRENPDEKKVGLLTGEVFDLKNQLHAKAEEYGIKAGGYFCGGPYGNGPRMGGRGGWGRGMMMERVR